MPISIIALAFSILLIIYFYFLKNLFLFILDYKNIYTLLWKREWSTFGKKGVSLKKGVVIHAKIGVLLFKF